MVGHPNVWCVYLATVDIEADADRAVAAGARLLVPPRREGRSGSMGLWSDPTGAISGMWQAGELTGFETVDEPGGVTWCDLVTPDPQAARRFYAEVFGYGYEDIRAGRRPAVRAVHRGDVRDRVRRLALVGGQDQNSFALMTPG